MTTLPTWPMTSSPFAPASFGSEPAKPGGIGYITVATPPRMPSVAVGVLIVTPAVWLICPPTKRITPLLTWRSSFRAGLGIVDYSSITCCGCGRR